MRQRGLFSVSLEVSAMKRWLSVAFVVACGVVPAFAGPDSKARTDKGKEVKVDGYAEWRAAGGVLVVDGQRIRVSSQTKLKLPGSIKTLDAVPLGYEIKAKGLRGADGVVAARELQAKPNGMAMFEGTAKNATNEMEQKWLSQREVYEEGEGGSIESLGKLYTDGHDVRKVRRMVRKLLPPYIDPEDFRVYVVENDEWNAFACANGMIVVYSALIEDMDDDELAIILGHEIAHATHEHTRREFKKAFWGQLVAAGLTVAAESIDDKTARNAIQLATLFSFMAWKNGYGRRCEDQADRVGLRYAYEAGYDIRKGPNLWDRFAKKYGEPGKVANFFFSEHSLSSARARNLEKEIALNYADATMARLNVRTDAEIEEERPRRREEDRDGTQPDESAIEDEDEEDEDEDAAYGVKAVHKK
jgi:Zn-dependent protease with chaperone function